MNKEIIMLEHDKLIMYMCKKYKVRFDFEDLLQEVRMYVFKRLDEYNPAKAKITTFVGNLASYGALTYVSKQQGLRIDSLALRDSFNNINCPASLDYEYKDNADEVITLKTYLTVEEENYNKLDSIEYIKSILTDKQLFVLDLHIKGYEQKEIAAILNVTQASVSGRLKVIRNKLKDL